MSIASNLSSLVSSTNVVVVGATTQSVSTSTGALIVRGGVGVAGNIYAGGNAIFAGTLTATTATFSRAVTISTTTNSASTLTGALIVRGGVGIGGSLFVGGVVTATDFFAGSLRIDAGSTMTNLVITGTNVASNTTTGALQVAGGVGIGGDIYFGGNLYQNGVLFTGGGGGGGDSGISSTGTTSTFSILNTSVSTSTTTGALRVTGGVGIGGDLYIGGALYDSGAKISPIRSISVFQPGNLTTTIGTIRWYAPFDLTVTKISGFVLTAPGAALIVTTRINGTGIADITVPGAATVSSVYTLPIDVSAGSYFTLDTTPTNNSATSGSDLYVVILYQAR